MAISFNTGTTATVTNSATPSGTVVIPAGVLSGDVVLVLVWVFSTATGTLTNTLTSTATTPVQVGAAKLASGAGIQAVGTVFSIAAGSGDHGATLTFGTTGGTGGSYWYNVGLVAYTGALGGVDVSNGTSFFSAASTGTTTTPSATTTVASDWQVQFLGVGPPSGNTTTTPSGLTSREAIPNNAGLTLEIADSNASVGGAGTSVGNTTWTYTGSTGNTWSCSFTVALAPTAPTPATSPYGALRQAARSRILPPGASRPGGATAELGPGTGNISSAVSAHAAMGASGGLVRNPTRGPAFRQAVQPVRARIPRNAPRGRTGSNLGAPVRNPAPVVTGPPFYPARQAIRIRPSLPPRGRSASNAGGPVRNPQVGPLLLPAGQPAGGPVILLRTGVAMSTPVPQQAPVPTSGPAFRPSPQAIRARLPQQPLLRGRTSANAGTAPRNPSAGPVFTPVPHPVRAPVPQVFSKGRTSANPGSAPRNPSAGPAFFPVPRPVRAPAPQVFSKGRTASSPGGPVANPVHGPAFRQATSPARIRASLPPRGRTASNPGGPVRNPAPPVLGPQFFPAVQPARIRPSLPPRGRTAGGQGAPVRNPVRGAAFPAPHGPVQARFPLPPRGRTAGNPGIPVPPPVTHAGPPFFPLHWPARIRPSLPPRGRVSANPGGAVRNPVTGPAFRQAVRPIRAVIPQNAPRGRTSGNPGGPVANIPFGNPVFRLGSPRFRWDTGPAVFQWETDSPAFQWDTQVPVTSS